MASSSFTAADTTTLDRKAHPPVSVKTVVTDPVLFLAFGFGTGLAPVAPGTVGTLVGVVIELVVRPLGFPVRIGTVVMFLILGVWLCSRSTRKLGTHDHPGIVWDEITGYLFVMLAAPAGWIWVVLGFALFRLFDIVKPWPIREVDHSISGGLGIMLDDVVAGIYAAAPLIGLQLVLPRS